MERMKSFGINAWRTPRSYRCHLGWIRPRVPAMIVRTGTAHNPPTRGLVEATDKLGLLVWDENHKVDRSAAAEILVRRDRNHPSVIIWYATTAIWVAQ